jgi:hypothetical protein
VRMTVVLHTVNEERWGVVVIVVVVVVEGAA